MIRVCDGTDPNLTRHVQEDAFDPAVMTVSEAWAAMAEPGTVIIQCRCGRRFDDEQRMTVWPHEFIGQQALLPPGWPQRVSDG